MPPCTIAVESRVVGQEASLDAVVLRLVEERITVAELIERTVVEQIRHLQHQRRMDGETIQRVLSRHYLTPEEIAAQAQQGRVGLPPRRRTPTPPQVDPRAEVRRALDAFREGRFCIFIQNRQVEQLEEVLTVEDQCKVVFLRLMPLVGG